MWRTPDGVIHVAIAATRPRELAGVVDRLSAKRVASLEEELQMLAFDTSDAIARLGLTTAREELFAHLVVPREVAGGVEWGRLEADHAAEVMRPVDLRWRMDVIALAQQELAERID